MLIKVIKQAGIKKKVGTFDSFVSVGGFNEQLEQNFLPAVSSDKEKMADFGSFFYTSENSW